MTAFPRKHEPRRDSCGLDLGTNIVKALAEFTDFLLDDENFMTAEFFPTVWRNQRTSDCRHHNRQVQITYSYASCDYKSFHGWRDYATVAWVWEGHANTTGLLDCDTSLWAVALHEVAHACMFRKYWMGLTSRDEAVSHGKAYQNELNALIARHPLSEWREFQAGRRNQVLPHIFASKGIPVTVASAAGSNAQKQAPAAKAAPAASSGDWEPFTRKGTAFERNVKTGAIRVAR